MRHAELDKGADIAVAEAGMMYATTNPLPCSVRRSTGTLREEKRM